MTRGNRELLRPSGAASLTGLLFSLASLLLIGLALGLSWRSAAGWVAAGFVICLSLLGQFAIGTVFSTLTAARVGHHLAEENCPNNFRESLRKNWLDLALFSLARPGLWINSRLPKLNLRPAVPPGKTDHQGGENGAAPDGVDAVPQTVETTATTEAAVSTTEAEDSVETTTTIEKAVPAKTTPAVPVEAAPQTPELAWIKASYMIIPIMGMEGLSFKESLPRAAEFVSSHALRLSIDVIGVRRLSWLASALLTLIGIAASWLVYRATSPLSHGAPVRSAVIACLAVFIFNLFILAAVAISSYLNTVYTTCLYLWSRSVEKVRLENLTGPASVPALLSAALEK